MLAVGGFSSALFDLPRQVEDLAWRLDPADADVTLADVEREVVRRYPVPDMAVSDLEAALRRNDVTLFDVRTVAEYETGHIPGAIRVDPETTAAAFLAEHGARLKDRPAVFYCAVGVRSSRMMRLLLQDIAPSATAGVHNLRGGAFRWVADGRSLVAGAEPGQLHPYDAEWERLLRRTLATQ
jgi:rhodanese-related sulfurtransferase